MTAGSQIRDFINVLEVAEKIYESLTFDDVISGHPLIKNIGTGEGKSILEFAEFWWGYWGATGVLKPNTLLPRTIDLPRIVADIHSKHIF
jgi:UDP-glucose 4-epimerase